MKKTQKKDSSLQLSKDL